MEVVCRCTACNTQFKVDEKFAGRKAKCPKCATVVVVPSASGVETAAAAPAASHSAVRNSSAAQSSTPKMAVPLSALPAPPKASDSSSVPIKASDSSAFAIKASPETAASALPAINITAAPTVSATGAAKPAPRKPAATNSNLPLVLAAGGGGLALVIVAVAVAIYLLGGFGKGFGPRQTLLIVDLSAADRKDVSVMIDGKKRKVPDSGDVKFELEPKEHRVVLQRRGYEPIEETLTLKAGDHQPFKPKWKASSVASASGSPGSSNSFSGGQTGVSGYGGWLQNLERAQREASQGKKDVLLVFVGSDWSDESKELQSEVFLSADFRSLANTKFVPVVIDLPEGDAAFNMLEDRAQNSRLRKKYHVTERSVPVLVLIDSSGRPYARHESFEKGQGTQYLEKLKSSLGNKTERDRILALPAAASGEARLTAAVEAIRWLEKGEMVADFGPEVGSWVKFAKEHDPANERGLHEIVFAADWQCKVRSLHERGATDSIKKQVAELSTWETACKFQDGDRGAKLHMIAAFLLMETNDVDGASRQLELGLACNPKDPDIRRALSQLPSLVRRTLGSGSGFVVAANGYIMTNHHVIDGAGRVVVRLPEIQKEPLPAEVVAKDSRRDMALIKVALPAGAVLKPSVVTSGEIRRSSSAAVFGFPLGDAIGASLKFTQGSISALADPANNGMMLLDIKVNPGNSGGPLCNKRGQVIGIVTAKTGSSGKEDSYGLARPAPDIQDFLKTHLPGYVPPPDDGPKESMDWEEVDRLISPSCVMILKVEG